MIVTGTQLSLDSFSAVPLNLTRFTELINQQFQKTKVKSDLEYSYKNGQSSQKRHRGCTVALASLVENILHN